jgi:hypothetical protein
MDSKVRLMETLRLLLVKSPPTQPFKTKTFENFSLETQSIKSCENNVWIKTSTESATRVIVYIWSCQFWPLDGAAAQHCVVNAAVAHRHL